MSNGRTMKKIFLLLVLATLVLSLSFTAASAQETTIDTQDIYNGIAILLAPGGYAGYAPPELIQARLMAFIILTLILVPTLSNIPLFKGGGF